MKPVVRILRTVRVVIARLAMITNLCPVARSKKLKVLTPNKMQPKPRTNFQRSAMRTVPLWNNPILENTVSSLAKGCIIRSCLETKIKCSQRRPLTPIRTKLPKKALRRGRRRRKAKLIQETAKIDVLLDKPEKGTEISMRATPMAPQTRILQMSKASRKSNKFRISISAGEYSWLIR